MIGTILAAFFFVVNVVSATANFIAESYIKATVGVFIATGLLVLLLRAHAT